MPIISEMACPIHLASTFMLRSNSENLRRFAIRNLAGVLTYLPAARV